MPSFDEIQEIHEADAPDDTKYVVRRNQVIVALRLRLSKNKNAKNDPAEVWVGDGPIVSTWGLRLSRKQAPVRLYVADTDTTDDYKDLGEYDVIKREATSEELKSARDQVKHGLSRVVFLRKRRTSHRR